MSTFHCISGFHCMSGFHCISGFHCFLYYLKTYKPCFSCFFLLPPSPAFFSHACLASGMQKIKACSLEVLWACASLYKSLSPTHVAARVHTRTHTHTHTHTHIHTHSLTHSHTNTPPKGAQYLSSHRPLASPIAAHENSCTHEPTSRHTYNHAPLL
jgi:hypothetical protein